jgi:cellulose synthase/poly-beta-1,6-N-acetylglucosamine synthase-like glycosyltransferase
LVLAGYCRQSLGDFEIVIADDGSGPEMPAFVQEFSRRAPFPIQYVCQPDEGFRKSRILNEAVRKSLAPYLIFADADCIPHSHFVAAHLDSSAAGGVLCGRRVNLNRRVSEGLTPQQVLAGQLELGLPGLLLGGVLGRFNHWEEGILIRNHALRSWIHRRKPVLFGCNFSLPKPLLERVNGFNEDFVAYWGEDIELQYRLQCAGAQLHWIRNWAIQYHLYHPQREADAASRALLEQARIEPTPACRNGLRKIE